MRIFTAAIMLILSQVAFAGADYAREKKWADEVTPGIVVGDPVYLELKQGHKFLAIFAENKNAKMGVIEIHGAGVHPDWSLIGTLRTWLFEQGYSTLSIQMPVLGNEAGAGMYDTLFPEAEERIAVAVNFLHGKGYKNIAIVSHSMGSAMSLNYVKNNQSELIAWVSLGMGHDNTYSGIHIPVLDLYGEYDLPPILRMAKKRAESLKVVAGSRQKMLPKSDHFYNNHEAEMVQEVKNFLDAIK